jgi:Domain of unknown function (DUF4184)
MPYTLSHVAAAVPFSRLLARLGVLSAVVIGSMVPDFWYLLPLDLPRLATHSAMALVTFCLPVGLLSFWLFQLLMKTPLIAVLPDQPYMRWQPYAAPASWRSPWQWLLAAGGVLGGAVVHLAWDGFAHEDGRGVRMVPELADPLVKLHGHLLTGARLVQDLSSLLGLALVILAIAYALRSSGRLVVTPRALSASERHIWVGIYLLTTLVCGAGFLILDHSSTNYQWIGGSIGVGSVAVALLRALVLAALCVSLLMRAYLRAKR